MKNDKILESQEKHFPSADKWMWDHCNFLGQFTGKNGDNFDLGILLKTEDNFVIGDFSLAIVYGDRSGSYISGPYQPDRENADFIEETVSRAKKLNLIK